MNMGHYAFESESPLPAGAHSLRTFERTAVSNTSAGINLESLLAHRESVFGICLGFSRNYAEAEDLAQDVYVKAALNLSRLKNSESSKEWLFRIAKNTCLDHQKKFRLRSILLRGWARESISRPSLDDEVLDDRRRRLKSAVRRLPKKLGAVFVLREYGGLSYEELAATLGLKRGTVMSRLSRARQKILTWVQENDHDRR